MYRFYGCLRISLPHKMPRPYQLREETQDSLLAELLHVAIILQPSQFVVRASDMSRLGCALGVYRSWRSRSSFDTQASHLVI